MGPVGPSEVLVVLVVALIVLGPERLPEAARQIGRFVGELRRFSSGFQAELRDAIDLPTYAAPAPDAAPAPRPEPDVEPPADGRSAP